MPDFESCTCVGQRPLGSAKHLKGCPLNDEKVVEIFRNTETGRPVAVPDEVVSVAEREYRAFKLHERGKSWTEVAVHENYPSAEAAAAAVKRYLDEGRAVVQDFSRKEVIAGHVNRLATLRDAMWDAAVEEKKTTAVMALLAIEDRWVRAFGLDQPDAEDQGLQTVVVPHDDYLEATRRAALEEEKGDPEADAG